jgi:hypothetical protein
MRKILAASIVVSLLAQPATANFFDGNKIHHDCQNAKWFALGYVAGAFDSNETAQATAFSVYLAALGQNLEPPNAAFDQNYSKNTSPLGNYCVPKGATLEQTTDVLCQYLLSTPAERHEPGSILLARALSKAWPCKPKR